MKESGNTARCDVLCEVMANQIAEQIRSNPDVTRRDFVISKTARREGTCVVMSNTSQRYLENLVDLALWDFYEQFEPR